MDKIFDRAKSEGRGLNGNSDMKGVGANSPAMMEAKKKIAGKMKGKGEYSNIKFTPKSEKEKKMFDRTFKSKTS